MGIDAPTESLHTTDETGSESHPDGPTTEAETEPASIALEARDLDVYYGDDQALRSIDMEIPEGEVTALIGPSGCGKSTFLHSINR